MPLSFEPIKIRNAYIRVKSLQNKSDLKLNDKTLEYFLYLFKSLKMWPEIIDLCENYDKLSANPATGVNEIKNYYLSDTLLQMPTT
jgi:hypothetical protein